MWFPTSHLNAVEEKHKKLTKHTPRDLKKCGGTTVHQCPVS